MASATKTKPFTARQVTVSGVTYDYARLSDWGLKPVSSRKIGGFGGVQYKYVISDRATLNQFVDLLAEAACVVADTQSDDHYAVLAIYKDLGKIL